MRRIRRGEALALVGALGLLAVLPLNWFGLTPRKGWTAYAPDAQALVHRSGWGALGWFMVALLVAVIIGGLAVAATAVVRSSPALPVGVAIVTWTGGALTFFVLLFVLIDQPTLGLSLPNDAVSQELPGYLGLLFCFLVPFGAWVALNDERTTAAESAYEPPPPRPVPEP